MVLFCRPGLTNSQLSQTAARVRGLELVVYETTAHLIASSMERYRHPTRREPFSWEFCVLWTCKQHSDLHSRLMRSVTIFSSYKRHLSQTEMLFPKMVLSLRENVTFLAEPKFASREVQMTVNFISLARCNKHFGKQWFDDNVPSFVKAVRDNSTLNDEILTCIGTRR